MLEGKRMFITGGAGFIGTTLARELVDRNTVVAFDNLHRDALAATALADHPNFTLIQGDVLDAAAVREAARGATHIVHCAAIAGVDTVLESPVRTMRVNVIGTYNVLEAAIASGHDVERFVDFSTSEVFGTHAFRVAGGPGLDDRLGRRGALDVRRLEARGRAHGARLPRRARLADGDSAPVQRLRPGADRRRRDPRVHRGGAPRRRPDDPRRRLADPRLVLRHRHGERRARLSGAPRGGRPGVQHRQPALVGHDLRPRAAHQAADAVRGEIVFQPLHYADVELRIPNVEKARELLGWEPQVELDDGLQKTIAWYRERLPVSA